MNSRLGIFWAAFIALFLFGCTPPKDKGETTAGWKPSGLVIVGTIEGAVYGKKLSAPKGIVADKNGSLYVIDSQNNRVVKFHNDLTPSRDAGGFGFGAGQLNQPVYVAIDNDLNLYVTEVGGRAVSVFDARLNFVERLELSAAGIEDFGSLGGVAVNQYGEIIVADVVKGRLTVLNNVGNFDRHIGGVENSTGYLLQPGGIVIDKSRNILVSDAVNKHVEIFDAIGLYDGKVGDGFLKSPEGLAVDQYGYVWVADKNLNGVYCFDYKGTFIYEISRRTSPQGYDLSQPFDVAVLPDGRLAVSDTGNNRILIFKIMYSQ